MKKMEFLYKPRGAGKRTVKPSKDSDNLEALVGGGDSGSDDSDFEVGKHSDDNSDVESDSGGESAKSGDDDDDSDDDDSEEDDQEEDDLMQLKKDLSTKELINVAASQKLQATVASSQGLNTVKVCGACLCNTSDDVNEIVECDGCGISVHEGCYGIQDSGSITSTASSDPTEPWFCEPCRANVKEPECELCPNRGGIYKETDVRKWIHLVCGLYVPNCNFFDPEGLSKATLFEINYGNWGRRVCGICKDVKYARTGVCIECDAGMCKQYFHVSCAQENGLLSEPKSDDQDSYFGHCKLHSDKEMIKKRKKNWLTHLFQSKQRGAKIQFDQSLGAEDSGGGETGAQRTLRKLERQRSRWTAARVVRDDPWVPTQKMPRLLTTSSSAMKKLSNKVDLQEWDGEQLEREQSAAQSVVDIRKKWNVAPAWSVEFVAYYHDRNSRIKSLQETLAKGVTANNEAKDDQAIVTSEYSRLLKESEAQRQTGEKLASIILSYHNLLKKAAPDKKLPPIAALGQRGKSPVKPRKPSSSHNTPSHQPASTRRGESSRTSISSSVSMSSPTPPAPVGLVSCAVCKHNNDQHLLAKCDVCKLLYHIGCLSPPLARMPKKTKQYGWQCSECDEKKDTAVDAGNVTVTGPRASRLRTNPRMSFDLGDSDDVESLFKESLVSPSEDLASRGRKGKRGLSLETRQAEDGPTPVKRSRKGRKSAASETSVNNNKDVDKQVTNSVLDVPISISSALENTKSKYSSPPISVSSDMYPITSATNLSENEVGRNEISRDPVANLPPKKSFKNKAILKDMSGVLNSAEVISPAKSSRKELVESNSAVSSPNSSGKRKPVSSVQNKTEFSDEIFHALHNGVVDEVTDSPKHNFSEVVAVNCLNTINTHNSSKTRVESPKPGKTNSTDLSQHFPQLNSPVDVKITRGDRKAAKAAIIEEAALAKAKEEKLKEAAAAKAREEKALKEAAATKAREEKALKEEKAAKALEEKSLKEAAAAKAREEKALKDAAAKLKKDKELAVAEKALKDAAAVKIKKDKDVAAAKVREEKAAKALEEKEAAAVKAREEKVNKELAVVKQKEEKGAAAKVRELLQAADAKEREEKAAAEAKAREEKEAAEKLSAESSSKKESADTSVEDASKKFEFETDPLRLGSENHGVNSSKDPQVGAADQSEAAVKASGGESAAAADGSSSSSAALAELEAQKAAAKMEKKRKKREEKERRKEEKRRQKLMLETELNDEEPEMEMEEDEDGNCVFRIAPRPIKLKIKPLPPKPSDPEPVTTSSKISNGGVSEANSWRTADPFQAHSSLDPFQTSSTVDSSSVDSPPKSADPPPKNHSEITHMHPKKKMAHLESLNNSLNYVNANFPGSCPVTSTVVSGGEPTPPPPVADPPPVAVSPPDPPPVNTPEAHKASPVRERPKRTPSSSSKKGRDVRTKCDVCFLEGSNLTLVRCDECKKCYHFMCLLPPIKKSPKLPGWSWHCTDCDPSDTDTGWHL